MRTSEIALGEAFESLSRSALRVKKQRDALLKACIAAHERLEVLVDAEEATESDKRVKNMLTKAILQAVWVHR